MTDSGVVALIPARAGSKGVPRKNITDLGGHPLIAYSIAAAELSDTVERVVVSTDSDEIAEIAVRYGAEAPFRRPAELASDNAGDAGFVHHAVSWLAQNEGRSPALLVELRPTTPLRDPALVDAAVQALSSAPEATSLRSAHELPEAPQKMLGIQEDGYFAGLFPDDPRPEYFNLPRQAFPPAYHPNGYVDVLRAEWLSTDAEALYGPKILAFLTPATVEIDTFDALDYLEFVLARHGHPLHAHLNERFGATPHTRRR